MRAVPADLTSPIARFVAAPVPQSRSASVATPTVPRLQPPVASTPTVADSSPPRDARAIRAEGEFARQLERSKGATLAEAQRAARKGGQIFKGLALGERIAGTGMALAPLLALHLAWPAAAGMALAGIALDLHAVQTARRGSKLFDFAVNAADLSAYVGKPAAAISKQEALQQFAARQAADRARADDIVQAHGCSSLARLALFDDKSYVFSPGGSVVAYAVSGRTAVALGDPIGPAQDFDGALATYLSYCKDRHWKPVFYQVRGDHLAQYRKAGLGTLCIGHEASVDVQAMSLAGKANKNLRSTVNRMRKMGYVAQVHEGPLDDTLLGKLRQVSDGWLTMMHGREKRFSLGAFDDAYVRQGPVAVVYTPAGEVSAFVNLMPEYRKNEVVVDLMRRTPDAANGTMDFLFVSLFEWAKARGYQSVSLGMSPLSGVGEKKGDPPAERAVHFLYEHANQFYNFKGLHAFKDKWGPTWSPRYLVCPGVTSLAPAALALMHLSSGDGFVQDYARDMVGRVLKPKAKAQEADKS